MLQRQLTKLQRYATLIGTMVGAGIFVAIGEAGKSTGPSVSLAYLLLGPVALLCALPYAVFHSTPIGNLPGGAYVHISRTFKSYFPGYIAMWLNWLTCVGVLSILSLSVGNYLQAFIPFLNAMAAATACLLMFYLINLFGVKSYGRLQSMMFYVLIICVALIVELRSTHMPDIKGARKDSTMPRTYRMLSPI